MVLGQDETRGAPFRTASPGRRRAGGGASRSRGFTLAELLVVVAIVAGAAGLLVVATSDAASDATTNAAATTLAGLRDAVLGTRAGGGYLVDCGALPPTAACLFTKPASVAAFDPATGRGWRGPYLRARTGVYAADAARGFVAAYGTDGDPSAVDPWGNPIVVQVPDRDGDGAPATAEELRHVRVVSAGPDGVLETPRTDAAAAPGDALLPPRSACGDDLVVYLRTADERP